MDYAGASFGTLGATFASLSTGSTGAITSTAQLPGPVDYQFLGGAQDDTRVRWFADQLRKADARRR